MTYKEDLNNGNLVIHFDTTDTNREKQLMENGILMLWNIINLSQEKEK